MKVWVLRCGCKFEGGGAPIAIYASEEAGLRGAEKHMKKEIARSKKITKGCQDEGSDWSVRTYYVKDRTEDTLHYWTEHSVHGSQEFGEQDYDHDFLALMRYDVHG